MSVRMKITRNKTGGRRSQLGLKAPRLSRDTKTGNVHIRHFMDPETGMYRGKQVIDIAGKKARRAEKAEARKELESVGADENGEEEKK